MPERAGDAAEYAEFTAENVDAAAAAAAATPIGE
jgi:hypothetical protein